jgi:hypothetical protein
MTIDQQIAYTEQMRHVTKGEANGESEKWKTITLTLVKFKRAEAIAQELEGDFRALAGMSLAAKGLKAAVIVTAKSHLFIEMGRIFLKI